MFSSSLWPIQQASCHGGCPCRTSGMHAGCVPWRMAGAVGRTPCFRRVKSLVFFLLFFLLLRDPASLPLSSLFLFHVSLGPSFLPSCLSLTSCLSLLHQTKALFQPGEKGETQGPKRPNATHSSPNNLPVLTRLVLQVSFAGSSREVHQPPHFLSVYTVFTSSLPSTRGCLLSLSPASWRSLPRATAAACCR